MQTKSYRLLKWTLLACVSASFASACVVTTGDGGGDDFFDEGGEGGTNNNTAGTKANTGGGGKTTTAGTSSGGSATGGGGAATAGTGGSSAGTGGTAPAYAPGICDSATPDQLEGPTPTEPADATLNADDEKPVNACRKCLKQNCETEWSTCYGKEPSIACGWGPTSDDQDGQFDCILGCFADGAEDPMGTAEELVIECSAMCTNQCEDEDNGNVMFHTSELVGCANDADTGCQAECFSF